MDQLSHPDKDMLNIWRSKERRKSSKKNKDGQALLCLSSPPKLTKKELTHKDLVIQAECLQVLHIATIPFLSADNDSKCFCMQFPDSKSEEMQNKKLLRRKKKIDQLERDESTLKAGVSAADQAICSGNKEIKECLQQKKMTRIE